MGQAVVLIVLLVVPAMIVLSAVEMLSSYSFQRKIIKLGRDLSRVIEQHFLTESCPRCHESEMELLAVSPNGRSIRCKCRHCNKTHHAPASSPEAFAAVRPYEKIQALIAKFNRRQPEKKMMVEIVFRTPEAPLPFEQTTRETIPEAVRTEVWRRDRGRCVKCGSNQNLEFDHIIPVSRGGATTARNLQLLCKSCNRRKGAKI